ncbi:MAG: transcriptional regulator [Clostridiales bacterium 44_9]|nr:MAG: transcriptional regulator [Clostridiales bacterium 44_9]
MAKRPVEKYDFKAFGEAIKEARKGRKESRKKVSDEMYISPRYLANIENNGQHPSLQKDTNRRQLDALLDDMSDTGIRIVTATAEEIAKVEKEGR